MCGWKKRIDGQPRRWSNLSLGEEGASFEVFERRARVAAAPSTECDEARHPPQPGLLAIDSNVPESQEDP
jgi:hypothetical protein